MHSQRCQLLSSSQSPPAAQILRSSATWRYASALFMQLAVTQLLVDPLAYLWYVLLWKLQRFSQGEAPGILQHIYQVVSKQLEQSDEKMIKVLKSKPVGTSKTKTPQSFSLVCCGIFCKGQQGETKHHISEHVRWMWHLRDVFVVLSLHPVITKCTIIQTRNRTSAQVSHHIYCMYTSHLLSVFGWIAPFLCALFITEAL